MGTVCAGKSCRYEPSLFLEFSGVLEVLQKGRCKWAITVIVFFRSNFSGDTITISKVVEAYDALSELKQRSEESCNVFMQRVTSSVC